MAFSLVATVIATGGFTGLAISIAQQRNTDLADSSESITNAMSSDSGEVVSLLRFQNVAAEVGINMHHAPGPRKRLLLEDTGSGLAWGDIDGDGDWDLFVANIPSGNDESSGSNRLYRNDQGHFVDISEQAGITDPKAYGMGVSFADFNQDGAPDIYVTNFGPNRLFQNMGDGTFQDVAAQAGVDGSSWSTGVAWGDIDRDGDLDLYVCNYLTLSKEQLAGQSAPAEDADDGIPIALNPNSFDPAANQFYLNNGDGTFTEMAEELGLANPQGRSLEAVFCDLDGNGFLDLYVNNDVSTNKLFQNLGGSSGTLLFADLSTQTGTADPRGSMGIAIAEIGGMTDNEDGLPDLFITHWLAQENALYQSLSRKGVGLEYRDKIQTLRLGEPSIQSVGWGTVLADFDLDGNLDIMIANGSTLERRDNQQELVAERPFLFLNDSKSFHEVRSQAGESFDAPYSGRGLAAADFDSDGDIDVAINVNRGAPLLFRNDSETPHHSISVRLEAPEALCKGAKITLRSAGRQQLSWWVTESSYLSGHAPEQIFGLGTAQQAEEIQVLWTNGKSTTVQNVPAGQITIRPNPSE